MYKSAESAELTEGATSGPVAPLPAALPPLVVKEWMGSADRKSVEVYLTNTLETRWRPIKPDGDQWAEETWRYFWIQDGPLDHRADGWVRDTPQIEKICQAYLCEAFSMGTVHDGPGIIELIVPDVTVFVGGRPVELHYECVSVRADVPRRPKPKSCD